jgi:hypothetical protein
MSLFGGVGGPRLASWDRAVESLGIQPLWRVEAGCHCLVGVTSSLLALPTFDSELLAGERDRWRALRAEHLQGLRKILDDLRPDQRLWLFCHDPTALPYLWREDWVRRRAPQIEQTIIGHLHTELILWKSRMLAGMPPIRFLGNSLRRMSSALHDARAWRHFKVRLCPALAGIELTRAGGYWRVELDPGGRKSPSYRFERLAWRPPEDRPDLPATPS